MIDYIKYLISKYEPIDNITLNKYYDNFNKVNYPYIISLDKDEHKYKNTFHILESLKFFPLKFKAIYGKNIKNNDKDIFNKFKNLTEGEVGCFLSHLSIYYLASTHKNQDQYTLVFEDDINTLGNDSIINQYINNALIYDCDLIYLGKCLEECENIKKISKNMYYGHKPLCLHAYMIKNSFAKKFINYLKEYKNKLIDSPIDWFIHNINQDKSNTLIFHPSLFYQDLEYESNLRDKKNQYSNILECRESIHYTIYNYFIQKFDRFNLIIFIILFLSILYFIIILFKKK